MKKLILILFVLFLINTIDSYSASKKLFYKCGFEESEGYDKTFSTINNIRYIKDWKLAGADIVKKNGLEGSFILEFSTDRKIPRLNSSHIQKSRMPSSS